MTDRMPDPLPAEWLPEPAGPAEGGEPELWDRRLRSLMSAAAPELERLAGSAQPGATGPARWTAWWTLLAVRWRPALSAAALAAAVLVALLRVLPVPTAAAGTADAFTLTAVAGDGTAAAVWQGLGAQADPTLAQIVLQRSLP